MGELAGLIGGSVCSDIVPGKDNVDAKIVRRHEEEQLERRIKEEAGQVQKRKCTPIEYLMLFGEVPKLEQVQVMKPEDLTKEDAVRLIEAGCTKKHLANLYNMSVGKLCVFLTEWDLYTPKNKNTGNPAILDNPEIEDVIWFTPKDKRPQITINKHNVIRISSLAILLAPNEYRNAEKIKARVGIHQKENVLIIQPVNNAGYILAKDGKGLRCAPSYITKYLQQRGISIPAVFECSWDDGLQAWIGRLVQGEQNAG